MQHTDFFARIRAIKTEGQPVSFLAVYGISLIS